VDGVPLNIELRPANLVSAPQNGLYADMGFGVLALISITWVLYMAIRRREPTPLVLVVGASFVTCYEPIVDVLGKIVYPLNYTFHFRSFNRHLPLWLFSPYGTILGLVPYFVARYLNTGNVRRKVLYLIAGINYMAVFLLDIVESSTGHYLYYGKGLGHTLPGSLVMAAFPIVSGYALYRAHAYKGLTGTLVTFFIPSATFGAAWAATSFPLSFALNTSLSTALDVLFRLTAIVQTIGLVWFVSDLACRDALPQRSKARQIA
jgi:hypothetical protein